VGVGVGCGCGCVCVCECVLIYKAVTPCALRALNRKMLVIFWSPCYVMMMQKGGGTAASERKRWWSALLRKSAGKRSGGLASARWIWEKRREGKIGATSFDISYLLSVVTGS